MYGIIAWVSAFKKLLFQIPIRAKHTGIFFSNEEFLKWLSIFSAPFKNFSKLSYPTEIAMESPTDPHIENRPPIKSYILKIKSLLIPKFSTAFRLDETAQK